MLMSTENQAIVFLATVYAGIIVGLFYDLYRFLRFVLKPGRWLTGVMDLFFWVFVAIFVFMVLFYTNDGEVRFFILIGLAAGWALYILTLSPLIIAFFKYVYKLFVRVLGWIIKVLKWPFGLIKKALRIPIRLIGAVVKRFPRIKEKGDVIKD